MDYLSKYFTQKTIDYSKNYPFEDEKLHNDLHRALNENDIFSMFNIGSYFFKKEKNKFVQECGVGWFFKIIDAYEKGSYQKFIYCGVDDSLNIYLNAKYLLSMFLLPSLDTPTEKLDNTTNENYLLGMKFLKDCAVEEFWDYKNVNEELFYRYSFGCGVDVDEEKSMQYAIRSLAFEEPKGILKELMELTKDVPIPEA